jgi:Ca2+-binding EF-hand superfamily protein
MLSPFRKRKLEKKFHVFDANGNGYLEKADFDIIVEHLAAAAKVAPGSPYHRQLTERYAQYWDHLQRFADVNRDGHVTLEEWTDYHEAALEFEQELRNAKVDGFTRQVADLIFDTVDRDGDGSVTREDYGVFCSGFQIGGAQCDEAFRHLDLNGDGRITRDEIEKAVDEFHFSDDPNAAGNWLYGPL